MVKGTGFDGGGVLASRNWMHAACARAEAAGLAGEIPVAALVVRGRRLCAGASNRVERDGDPTAHAEILAIRAACRTLGTKFLEDATLWTTLEPCAMCAEAIAQARVRRLVFGAWDTQRGAVWHTIRLYERADARYVPEVIGGVCASESQAILHRFFHNLRTSDADKAHAARRAALEEAFAQMPPAVPAVPAVPSVPSKE